MVMVLMNNTLFHHSDRVCPCTIAQNVHKSAVNKFVLGCKSWFGHPIAIFVKTVLLPAKINSFLDSNPVKKSSKK